MAPTFHRSILSCACLFFGGHGEGVFSSKCFVKGKWAMDARDIDKDPFNCHDPKAIKCTCNCAKGYLVPDCRAGTKPNTRDGYRRCRVQELNYPRGLVLPLPSLRETVKIESTSAASCMKLLKLYLT